MICAKTLIEKIHRPLRSMQCDDYHTLYSFVEQVLVHYIRRVEGLNRL